jgi:hypothetical protein
LSAQRKVTGSKKEKSFLHKGVLRLGSFVSVVMIVCIVKEFLNCFARFVVARGIR